MAIKESYYDSPDEYFEKLGGWFDPVMRGASKLWGHVGKPGVLIPGALGLGALSAGGMALGATGVSKALEGDRAGNTLGYRIDRGLNTLFDRVRADEAAGEAFSKQIGAGAATALLGLTVDMASKGYQTIKDRMGMSPTRQKIFGMLKREDPTLAQADNKTLLEAYHTMAKIAPTLASDKNAVRSFLTEAATAGGGGLDYQTIKGIAEAESAVRKATEIVSKK